MHIYFCKVCEQPFGRKKNIAIIKPNLVGVGMVVVHRGYCAIAAVPGVGIARLPTAKDTTIGPVDTRKAIQSVKI